MDVPRAALGVAAAGLVAGLPLIAIGLSTDTVEPRWIWALFGPVVGRSFIGAGLHVPARPPSRRSAS